MAATKEVLTKPLSGREIKDIILAKLASVLNGDSRLADYVAHPSFKFRIDLGIVLTKAEDQGMEYSITEASNFEEHYITHHLEQT